MARGAGIGLDSFITSRDERSGHHLAVVSPDITSLRRSIPSEGHAGGLLLPLHEKTPDIIGCFFMARGAGIEPATRGLTVRCSAAELPPNVFGETLDKQLSLLSTSF